MANRPTRLAPCLLAGLTLPFLLPCNTEWAYAQETDARTGSESSIPRTEDHKRIAEAAKGPYFVDFRARTAASWGHAFVWYGKTSERAVEVAGLTPAGDTLEYILGHVMPVPSDTGASYGDLDPEYLTAHYRVYLNEADAKKVFAYIKKLRASTPVWNAETMNCTGFIGSIAEFMGLKTPNRWQRPENYVNNLRAMNGGRQIVHLSSAQ